jgi:hypothetical protein
MRGIDALLEGWLTIAMTRRSEVGGEHELADLSVCDLG